MSWMQAVKNFLAAESAFGLPPKGDPKTGVIPPRRPRYPCGIKSCLAEQLVLRQDEDETVVECPEHLCVTTWETKERAVREQRIIRAQDAWRQHGVAGPPKR